MCYSYPLLAPGYRGHGIGSLCAVGHEGFNWSSTSYYSDDYYRGTDLGFNATWLNPNSAYYRSSSRQLRCRSE
ncbi:hypothetical protein [uncultured Rikenella sp.]|uniref:hypothetical protein n=1 Tax=uncultured Rikenella sp. TaxID=368003 RepID=UPI00272A7ED6|nr:hypothetical protein [uncultured Rikenella sp.]